MCEFLGNLFIYLLNINSLIFLFIYLYHISSYNNLANVLQMIGDGAENAVSEDSPILAAVVHPHGVSNVSIRDSIA